ncbi:transcriptional regulator, MarR family domain protein [Burkholderia pseudomallei]|nr:transcriptional regulator, MarR family domain protein [Burkholderia pseudomallei]
MRRDACRTRACWQAQPRARLSSFPRRVRGLPPCERDAAACRAVRARSVRACGADRIAA